jgi:hypothetical protein
VTVLDRAPDWKVTTGYRVMLAVGWSAFILALYLAVVAFVLSFAAVWWIAGGFAVLALVTSVMLPEPVPAEMITGGRNHIDGRVQRPSDA